MKICRYDNGKLGLVMGESIVDVTDITHQLPSMNWPYPPGDQFFDNLAKLLPKIATRATAGATSSTTNAAFLAPVANPGKVVAAPINYEAHFVEATEQPEIKLGKAIRKIADAGLFLKATSSIVGAAAGVTIPFTDRRSDHEIELAMIIGTTCRNCNEGDALDYVAGYTIGLDMTVRGVEDRSFRKSLDTYTVLGPWFVTTDEIANPDRLDLEIRVNGQVRQQSNTSRLIFGTRKLIAWASRWYTLYPGDIIMTGTPEGVGPIADGDRLDCSIERIGTMTTFVRSGKPLVSTP